MLNAKEFVGICKCTFSFGLDFCKSFILYRVFQLVFILREIEEQSSSILSVENGNTVSITNLKVPEQNAGDSRERIRRFTFDFCFHENSTQDDVFQAVDSVIGNAIKRRYHSCVLAYGQSSSGKTHTMMGFSHDPGLTPKLCERIFGYLQESALGDEEIKTSVSYLEIYNEKVRDLLNNNNERNLKVREHPRKGPYVQGLSEHPVEDFASLLKLLHLGTSNRRVAATLSNPQSSRSHSVFTVTCCGVKLSLVDLAGSEKAGYRCYGTSRFREGSNINKSLVALGNVISALAEQSKVVRRRFVPYRDSVLTWLLKDTLSGNSNTVMIATISPSSSCYSETVNTLRFGQRAKLIVSTPVVNEDPKEKTIRELRAEIARLRELLSFTKTPEKRITQTPMSEFDDSKESSSVISTESDTNDSSKNSCTETLMPVMDVTSTVNEDKKHTPVLRRTLSIDRPLPKTHKIQQESLRKRSMDKSNPFLKTIMQKKALGGEKSEKSTGTDSKPVENKTQSRRSSLKSRSQIVAAVTDRLYSKTKKKEASTDTDDMSQPPVPKELAICSNARSKLKELTQKMMKNHKSRNEETQTDLFPILRVKEVSTDVSDLKTELKEMRNMEISTETVQVEDKNVGCSLLESLQNPNWGNVAFLLTRSCGTQSSSSNVSFTKYLKELQEPSIEVNPIYTSSVNINISHNYNGTKSTDCVSDDSLEEQNVVFPDLISNHNSLETESEKKLNFAKSSMVQEQFVMALEVTEPHNFDSVTLTTPDEMTINIPSVCAAQICLTKELDTCQNLNQTCPKLAKPTLIEPQPYQEDCVKLTEPLVLKSIMKHVPEAKEPQFDEVPDSLEYHLNNTKKVHFTRNDRMLKAMSEFLEEATSLMNNLKVATSKLESLSDLDVQVTVNEFKTKRRRKVDANSQTEESSQKNSFDNVNKYDVLVEDSCKRLEEKIRLSEKTREHFSNPWDFNDNEDTSIESNAVSFSDYGSLPRRRKRMSPSAFLKQLTNLRRQVVESSREELNNHN